MATNTAQFKVPVVRTEPRIHHLVNCDPLISNNQRARRLLASMPGVALDLDIEQPLVGHTTMIASAGSCAYPPSPRLR